MALWVTNPRRGLFAASLVPPVVPKILAHGTRRRVYNPTGAKNLSQAKMEVPDNSTHERTHSMKHIATVALMLNLGVAGVYAQHRPVKMTFSGSMVRTALNLQPDSVTDEELLAGSGTLGSFTLRKLRTDGPSRPSATCSGTDHDNIAVVAGAGVFRFEEDGSLLTVVITGGDLCIDFTAAVGHLTETYQITGGTGRFKGASGTLKLTASLSPVLADASGPVFLTTTGKLEGRVFGVDTDREGRDDGR